MFNKTFIKLISLILAATVIFLIPVVTKADEITSKRYCLDDFEIEYNIISSWDNNQHISITITNTGEQNIENWKLYYDFNGDINSIWNAVVEVDHYGLQYIKCMDYNSVIMPNSSVTFGYLISNIRGVPEQINAVSDYYNSSDNLVEEPIIYYKEAVSEDDIAYDNDGERYFRNQIIIMASENAVYEDIENFSHTISADIVGYIELTNEYQLEFSYDVDFDFISDILQKIETNPLIYNASVNYIFDLSESYCPNDPESNLQDGISINNWNLEAINASRAWDYIDEMEYVNIGLMDSIFYKHDDISFKEIFNQKKNADNFHGTFTAGIMAAIFDNGEGISGICPKNNLYAYSMGNSTSCFKYSAALTKLIQNNVKVINVSMVAFDSKKESEKKEKINNGDERLIRNYNIKTTIINLTLQRLIRNGYDFVIVVAAGNDGKYGYNAKYANYLSNIDTSVKKNIIVVGGLSYQGYEQSNQSEIINVKPVYNFADYSNIGERVDVVAPGVNIRSLFCTENYIGGELTISSKYINDEGTSFAAPHVSGIAGMMYSVNPNLSGFEVKEIIKNTSKLRTVWDSHNNEYGIADAKLAVSTAYYYNPDKTEKIIFGKLEDPEELSKIYSYIQMTVSYKYGESVRLQNISSDENGEYEIIVPKEVLISDLTIQADGYNIIKTECLGQFWNSCAVIETQLTPIETSITGTVTEYNTTTGVTRPLAAHGVAVYQDGILAASAVTSSDGTYYIELNRQGDFIVDFGGDKQTDILINSNGEYTVNAVFEVCDEEDTDGGDGEDDNEDDGDDEDDDSGNTEETDDVIIDIDIYDNTGIDPNDEGYTGNNAVSGGNFADGVTIRSKDGSYINIYYDGSYCNVWINAQSHIWFYTYGALKYDKFDANGNLISSGVIDSWLMDAMYYDTTLVYKTYITGIKITAYSDRIRVDYTYHKEQKYYGGLGDLLGESYDRSSYQNIMR